MTMTMTNAQTNALFLQSTDARTRKSVLGNIAKHYGVTREEIQKEVTAPGAEHLLDYVTVDRPVVHLLMKLRGCSN